MSYDIYIENKDKSKMLQFPIIPPELPELNYSIENEEFKTYSNGTYSFIKEQGLYNFTLESWLPTKKYNFAKSSVMANEILKLLDDAVINKEYVHVIIIKSDGSTYVNNIFSIEPGFKYKIQKDGNYSYSLPLKRYREPPRNAYVEGWNHNATGWWYCYDYANYKWYANEWKQIDGEWYYFNENGYALENQWTLWKNVWFYLDENCKMVHNKWLQIDGKWYYFFDSGEMARNTTIDGYYVNNSGAWEE